MNDEGFFTHPKEVIAAHGAEDITWNDIIHDRVSDNRL